MKALGLAGCRCSTVFRMLRRMKEAMLAMPFRTRESDMLLEQFVRMMRHGVFLLICAHRLEPVPMLT